MNYGFVINTQRCIGCHACSTACKSENEVPLGVHRTWVKYVEHGRFPDVSRSFQVSRCNHCDNPPCARICPVTAMYQRSDGIVEFDSDSCIGCKACMQACPYDAIHIDPDTGTAAKCHYCAHRVDLAMEPACVVVCPTHAIIAGDMDDPMSEIARTIAGKATTVRKPEQGTAPKLLYINGEDVALHPTVFSQAPQGMSFSDVVTEQGLSPSPPSERALMATRGGTPIRRPAAQGLPPRPIQVGGGGRMAEQMVQVAWNAQHKVPWHWPVPAYLVSKGVGAGIFMFLTLGWSLGLFPFDLTAMLAGGSLSIVAILVTTGLLVYDLERPERFLSILYRPQWKSWLVRGAYLLLGFATVSALWWTAEAGAALGWMDTPSALTRSLLGWLTLPLSVGAAVYTAWLFAQAEGRDLWQSPLLPLHLFVQALIMGAGSLLLLDVAFTFDPALTLAARWSFGAGLVVDLAMLLLGEFGVPHASEIAARAAHEITAGKYKQHFWWGSIALGHVLPLALLLPNFSFFAGVAALCAGVGLYLYEYAFVMAPQEIPNS